MFFYLILFAALLHLLYLYHYYRAESAGIPENDKALMFIAAAVTLSLPFLGLFSRYWVGTLVVLTAIAFLAFFHDHPALHLEERKKRAERFLRRWQPLPCLAIAIVGLFCWGWYW